MGENATLPHSCLNVEHLGISNVCFHTATGVNVEGLEYVDVFVRDPVEFQYFSRVTYSGCRQKLLRNRLS